LLKIYLDKKITNINDIITLKATAYILSIILFKPVDIQKDDTNKKSLKIPKGAIRIRISKKNRQHNGTMKKYKKTNNDLQNIHIELKIK
jgi:hypothetical protein